MMGKKQSEKPGRKSTGGVKKTPPPPRPKADSAGVPKGEIPKSFDREPKRIPKEEPSMPKSSDRRGCRGCPLAVLVFFVTLPWALVRVAHNLVEEGVFPPHGRA